MSEFLSCDAVCMDVDSTVCTTEAIDELAAFAGVQREVAAMTARAMSGTQSFTDALRARLELIQPSVSMLQRFIATHRMHLTPGVKDFIEQCAARRVAVYFVSGGFTDIIHALVRAHGLERIVPRAHIFANVIRFRDDDSGAYAGFDESQPTSQDGGKAEVVRRLLRAGASRVCMIGDGATDAQARPPARIFIGYGGIAVRDKVRAAADAYVFDFRTLTAAVSTSAASAAVAAATAPPPLR